MSRYWLSLNNIFEKIAISLKHQHYISQIAFLTKKPFLLIINCSKIFFQQLPTVHINSTLFTNISLKIKKMINKKI
jgi:hypothetical protein